MFTKQRSCDRIPYEIPCVSGILFDPERRLLCKTESREYLQCCCVWVCSLRCCRRLRLRRTRNPKNRRSNFRKSKTPNRRRKNRQRNPLRTNKPRLPTRSSFWKRNLNPAQTISRPKRTIPFTIVRCGRRKAGIIHSQFLGPAPVTPTLPTAS